MHNKMIKVFAFTLLMAFAAECRQPLSETLQFMEIVERGRKTCMGCQLVMGAIHGLLENAMHDSLLPYLREKCEDVGPTVDAELCRSFTGEKGKILAGMVADVLEANTFCYLVRLCSADENKKRELML